MSKRRNPSTVATELESLLDSLRMYGYEFQEIRVDGMDDFSDFGTGFEPFPSMSDVIAETKTNMEGVIDTLLASDQALLVEKAKAAKTAGTSVKTAVEDHRRYLLEKIVEGNMTASGLRSQLKAAESRADNLEKRLFETTNSYLKASRYETRLDRLLGQIISSVGSEVRFTAEDIAKIIERVDRCEHVERSRNSPLEPAHCCNDACCKYVKAELTMASDIKVTTEATADASDNTQQANAADDNNTTGDNTNQQDDANSAAG
ncbi:MAG: hypothetical protein IT410_03755 [Candidatus Doudnabacteria bacterium]|nr:hypothetical protein [Candidatus Doudnabacteria bacterium]